MGIPKVTIGQATAQRSPNATIGRATGQSQPTLLSVRPPKTNSLTLQQVIEAADVGPPILVIAELTGHQRVVQLSGRALPYRPNFRFAAEQNIDEGKYTGFPRVNQTVLGASERETEINGTWKDRFLGDTSAGPQASVEDFVPDGVAVSIDSPLTSFSPLLTARDLVMIFEDILYGGRPLRFKWLHIRRIGRLCVFEHNWLNAHDVEWKMTFKWIGRDEQIGLPSPARTTLHALAQEFNAAYTDVHEATNFDGIDDLDPRFADRVDASIGRIQGAISDIEGTIETRVTAVSDLGASLLRASSIATYIRDRAQELIDALDGVVYPAMLVAQHPGAIVPKGFSFDALTAVDLGQSGQLVESMLDTEPGAAITAACQNRAAVQLARKMRHVAARRRFATLRQLEDDSLAVVVLRDQQDLRDIALEWYGNAEDWEQIRRANGLSTVSPPAGTVIFVPNPGTSS